jgi:hypothetical protein
VFSKTGICELITKETSAAFIRVLHSMFIELMQMKTKTNINIRNLPLKYMHKMQVHLLKKIQENYFHIRADSTNHNFEFPSES